MTKEEYGNIKERMIIIQDVCQKADWARQISEQYPQLNCMTLLEVKEWLCERAIDIEVGLKRSIGVI